MMGRIHSLERFHLIQHPDGKRRVEFSRTKDGTWTFALANLRRRRWFHASQPHAEFRSYAAALVEAGRESPWIIEMLNQTSCGYDIELHRGLAFRFATYDASIYGDHHHCVACWKTLLPPESPWPGAEHEGYVTRYEIPDGSERWQSHWVCTACFSTLRRTMGW